MEEQPKKKSRFRFNIFSSIIFFFLLFILGFIIAFPALVSTSLGQAAAIRVVNAVIPGHVEIEKVHLTWFSGHEIDGFSLKDPQGREVVAFDHFSTEANLLQSPFGRYYIGETELLNPKFHLINDEEGNNNLEEALSTRPKERKKSRKFISEKEVSIPFRGKMHIVDGLAIIEAPKIDPITLYNVNLEFVDSGDAGPMVFQLMGKTKQGLIEGDFMTSASFEGSLDRPLFHLDFKKGTFLTVEKGQKVHVLSTFNKIPVAAIDQLISYDMPEKSGLLTQALGTTLDSQSELTLSQEEALVKSSLSSTNLKANIQGTSRDGNFELDPSSQIFFTLIPAFVNPFLVAFHPENSTIPPWQLNQKTELTLSLKKLSLNLQPPISKTTAFVIQLDLARTELSHVSLGNFSLDLSAVFETQSLNEMLNFNFLAKIQGKQEPSELNGSAHISHLFDEKGRWDPEKGKYEFDAAIASFPIELLTPFNPGLASVSTFLGKQLSVTAKGLIDKDNRFVNLFLASPYLKSEQISLAIKEKFELLSPVNLTYRVTPQLINSLVPDAKIARIADGNLVNITLEKLSFPFSKDLRNSFESSGFFALDSLTIKKSDTEDLLGMKDLEGTFSANSFEKVAFSLAGDLFFAGKMRNLVGDETHFALTGRASQNAKNKSWTLPKIDLSLNGPQLDGKIEGNVDSLGLFSLDEPAKLTLIPNPDSLKEWIQVTQEGKLTLNIDTLRIPFHPFKSELFELDLKGKISPIGFRYGDLLEETQFQGTQFSATYEGSEDTLTYRIFANSLFIPDQNVAAQKGIFKVDGKIINLFIENKLDWKKAHYFANADIDRFPVFLLDLFSKEGKTFSALIGSTMKMRFNGNYSPDSDPAGIFDLEVESRGFQAALAFSFNKEFAICQEKPIKIHWDMTPSRYKALMKLLSESDSDFELLTPASVDVSITQLQCPTMSVPSFADFMYQSGLVAWVQFGQLNFKNDVTNEEIAIVGLNGSLQGENFSQAISIKTHGKLFTHNQSASFDFDGQLNNTWTAEGKWNHENATLAGNLDLQQIPVTAFTGLIPLPEERRKELRALLGDTLNAHIAGQISRLSGPLDIQIQASNLKATAAISLNEGNVTLRDTAHMEVTLTPEVSETFLKDINPLLITAAHSDHPIHLYLEPTGFFVPLRPFNLQGVRIEKAVIDFGKIRVRNGGQIQSLMQFVKAKEITPEGEMEAWFTPIFMSLKEGVASYKRFDALIAGNVQIASWGEIDLIKDRVNMILAISPYDLQRVGVLGLTKKDMFQIKMRGTTENVTIDWSSAYKRIGMIIARTAGGPPGYIIGGLLELFGDLLGEETTPPPTTTPFPWENSAVDREGVPKETKPKANGKKAMRKLFEYLIP